MIVSYRDLQHMWLCMPVRECNRNRTRGHRRTADNTYQAADLIHIEIALQDPLLHSIRLLWLLRHLADRRLHDSNTLRALVWWNTQHRRRTRDRAALGTGAEVFREVVAFAYGGPCQRVFILGIVFNVFCDCGPNRRNGYRTPRGSTRR